MAGAILAGGTSLAKKTNVDKVLKDATAAKYNQAKTNKKTVDALLKGLGLS